MLHVISRFAPSPTGRLHLGHAWSALLAHDVAHRTNGGFLLRIEDIDQTRCRPEFIDAIYEDLHWLGLTWDDEVMIQSERMEIYREALTQLDALGVMYRCTCTRAEVGEGRYKGTCRALGHTEGTWRIDMAKAAALTGPLHWYDRDQGWVSADPIAQGDVVLARKDIGTSYHLSVTMDDAAQGITHIVRGRDLFSGTHIHRLLQALLGLPTPQYQHHPLIAGCDGTRLAKSKQSPALALLREQGIDPQMLIEMMREKRFPVGFALAPL
ncbi:MAG: tRNA glutamyl-Q(34) synthetase GluQRS [Pseudomonadota bacterium]